MTKENSDTVKSFLFVLILVFLCALVGGFEWGKSVYPPTVKTVTVYVHDAEQVRAFVFGSSTIELLLFYPDGSPVMRTDSIYKSDTYTARVHK